MEAGRGLKKALYELKTAPKLKPAAFKALNTPAGGRNIAPTKTEIKMIIGTLNQELKGKISTLEYSFQLKLTKNNDRRADNSPTHEVVAINRSGDFVKIGSAWERTITKGEKTNQQMYSLALDDPQFKSPLNCTAFPADNGYNIVFDRQTTKTAEKEEF